MSALGQTRSRGECRRCATSRHSTRIGVGSGSRDGDFRKPSPASPIPRYHEDRAILHLLDCWEKARAGQLFRASALASRANPDKAVERAREAVTLAERVSHPFSQVLAAKTMSELLLLRREPAKARRLIAEWNATSTDLALPLLTNAGEISARLGVC